MSEPTEKIRLKLNFLMLGLVALILVAVLLAITFYSEGFSMDRLTMAGGMFLVLWFFLTLVFLGNLAVMTPKGILNGKDTLYWEDIRQTSVSPGRYAVRIYSEMIPRRGYMDLIAYSLCWNRREVAEFIAQHAGKDHPLYEAYVGKKKL